MFSKCEAPRGPVLGLRLIGSKTGFTISWHSPESRPSASPGDLISTLAHCLIFREELLGGSYNRHRRLHGNEGGAGWLQALPLLRGSSASIANTEELAPSSHTARCSVFWEVPMFSCSYLLLSEVGRGAASPPPHLHRHCSNYSTTDRHSTKNLARKGTAKSSRSSHHNSFISGPHPWDINTPSSTQCGDDFLPVVQKINQ